MHARHHMLACLMATHSMAMKHLWHCPASSYFWTQHFHGGEKAEIFLLVTKPQPMHAQQQRRPAAL